MATSESTLIIPSAERKSTWAQIRSFDRAFWASNVMELIERWAYYGVRTVLSLYIVLAATQGGLEFTHIQKGTIYMWWALIQSLLPMFTGGYADRYGYKKTVAIAISIKIVGYLLMGTQHSFTGFFIGCMLLATGTAIFKPGVQGIIANSALKGNAAVGWGIFYAMVNIGGFVGPWAAGYLRMMSWSYVFYANAILVALNFLTLLMFKEPARAPQAPGTVRPAPLAEFLGIIVNSVRNLLEPKLIAFLLLFSGFWLMFMQLFDLLPNFIDDWVDSAGVMAAVGHMIGNHDLVTKALAGAQVPPEWMVNVDAGAIVLLMVPIAALFSRLKPIRSIITGIAVAIFGIVMSGATMNGAWCLLGIFIFAIGEMMSSPKTSEYIAGLAPADKRGQYMGYANVPLAIGWGIGSKLGGWIYETRADKVNLAREYMTSHLSISPTVTQAIPKEKVMNVLATITHQTPRQVTEMLFALNHPERIWYMFGAIGLASMIGLIVYDQVLTRTTRRTA